MTVLNALGQTGFNPLSSGANTAGTQRRGEMDKPCPIVSIPFQAGRILRAGLPATKEEFFQAVFQSPFKRGEYCGKASISILQDIGFNVSIPFQAGRILRGVVRMTVSPDGARGFNPLSSGANTAGPQQRSSKNGGH